MLLLLSWVFYGLLVGLFVRALHGGVKQQGCLVTILLGIAGSYVGGTIHYLLDMNQNGSLFQPSGILMGIIGGVVMCYAWDVIKLKLK